MYYHRRYLGDGNCEVICTHCFQTVGITDNPHTIRSLEAAHLCNVRASEKIRSCPSRENAAYQVTPERIVDGPSSYAKKLLRLPFPLLLVAVPLVLYGLPTLLEMALQRLTNPWLASIMLGDLAACAFLFVIFNMRRTGLLLYLVLIIAKGFLYSAQIIPANLLLWIADIIPALFVLIKIARMRTGSALRTCE